MIMRISKMIYVFSIVFILFIHNGHAAIFTDSFNDSDFTNSHWQDGNPAVPQIWSFIEINGPDLGYHASVDVPPTSTEEPAVRFLDNSGYFASGLYMEVYARIDSHPDSFITENKIVMGLDGIDGLGYGAEFRLNFEQAMPIIDLNLSISGSGLPDPILADIPVAIQFDTFYKLIFEIMPDRTMAASLYDLDDIILGSISSPNVVSSDQGVAAIGCRYECTYNNFYLSGTPAVPVPGAIWLFSSGFISLICVARRKQA